MFAWAVDDIPQLGAGTKATLLGCWAKARPEVSAAPVSAVAEGSSCRHPEELQASWAVEEAPQRLAKILVVQVCAGLPPEQLRDSHHGSAAGPNKWVWRVKGA